MATKTQKAKAINGHTVKELNRMRLIDRIRHLTAEFPKKKGYNAQEMHRLLQKHELIHPVVSVLDVADEMMAFYR